MGKTQHEEMPSLNRGPQKAPGAGCLPESQTRQLQGKGMAKDVLGPWHRLGSESPPSLGKVELV